jgi:Mn-dependent DtxR family transcriptional regulator
MTSQTKKATAVLAGSVVLASAAYALGSQAGDGDAIAGSPAGTTAAGAPAATAAATGNRGRDADRRHHHGGPGLSRLAERLGVSASALRTALTEIRREQPSRAERRQQLAAALAAALGLPADRVTSALDRVAPDRGARRDRLAEQLAAELGVDAAKVRAALDKVRRGHHDGRDRGDGVAAELARALGVDAAKVRAALQKLRGDRRDGHRGARRDDRLEALADALGVSEDRLETALRKVRDDQRDAFAARLAKKLGISAAKVRDALGDLPHRGRHGG